MYVHTRALAFICIDLLTLSLVVAQWKESIAHFKRRLVGREEDLEGARTTFEDFFKDQLMHLKESIGNKLKRDAIK